MKNITVEYKVFSFDELSEDIKKELIEKEKEIVKEDNIEFCL